MSTQTAAHAPLRLALVGCGALSEMYYAPVLKGLVSDGTLSVAALIDSAPSRIEVLAGSFPGARRLSGIENLARGEIDVAIVASPQKFHAAHAIALLRLGVHVLCEKPMASTLAEAKAMVDAADEARRLLAVGHFRRFFPSSQLVKELIAGGALGKPVSFEWSEGGPFNWPAASPSFFRKETSPGGVFADIGAHVLDLLLFWFGEPGEFSYEDDAMGGLESNARLVLCFEGGVTGSVRLSRDTAIPNGTRIQFERGSVWFAGASADSLTIQLQGCSHVVKGALHEAVPADSRVDCGEGPAGWTYARSFTEQVRNFCRAVRGEEPLRVPGREALPSMRLIENCYRSRRLMPMPWMTAEELEGISRLAGRSIPDRA